MGPSACPWRDTPPRTTHRRVHRGVWKTLGDAGRQPTPNRTGPSWSDFVASQAPALVAAGFFCIVTVSMGRFHGLFLIEIDTRRVHLAGITTNPAGSCYPEPAHRLQQGRQVRDPG
ncbi:MAG: hypothetical protein GY698_00790 [Actinomycetia bacterium]|nr:hypothetical protein [Actinomycetes bacterium]